MRKIMREKGSKGFTMVELILVITVLGILAVAALPTFLDVSTDAKNAAKDGVVGAVRSGLGMYFATEITNGNVGSYPALLDTVDHADGTNGAAATPLFDSVLAQGVTDDRWEKTTDTTYTYTDGAVTQVYTYSFANGTFQ